MSHEYNIQIKDTAGVPIQTLVTWRSLRFTRRVNGLGGHQLTLNGGQSFVNDIGLDFQIEINRSHRNPTIASRREYEGFHRTQVRSTPRAGLDLFTSFGVSYEHLLERRAILYRSGTSQSSKSGAGETVLKEFVDENAGPGAGVAARIASGITPGLSIQPDGAAGTTWTGARAWRNLLAVAQEISEEAGVDFQVVGDGPATFVFNAQATPIGDDRSVGNPAGNPPVIFALNFSNMISPVYSLNRRNELTAAVVLGQGQAAARVVVERQNAATIGNSPWNRIERTHQGNLESTTAGLNAIGDALLDELAPRESFSFTALQTPALAYGLDYFLGDIVTARYKTIERNYQIVAITFSVEDGQEVIDLEVKNIA